MKYHVMQNGTVIASYSTIQEASAAIATLVAAGGTGYGIAVDQ